MNVVFRKEKTDKNASGKVIDVNLTTTYGFLLFLSRQYKRNLGASGQSFKLYRTSTILNTTNKYSHFWSRPGAARKEKEKRTTDEETNGEEAE